MKKPEREGIGIGFFYDADDMDEYLDDLESRLAEEKERAKFIRNQNIDLVQACEELRKRLKEAEAKVEGYERVFKILRNHKDLPPEFATVINENFWELI